MSSNNEILKKPNHSKSIIKYTLVGLIFFIALFLSTQSDGPSKFPKEITDQFTFTAWVNEGEDYLKKKLQMDYQNHS